jgi:hypothetical protein
MPRLPSGRHVAITLAPFSNFLDQKKEEGNIDKVLAIKIVEGPGARLWGPSASAYVGFKETI